LKLDHVQHMVTRFRGSLKEDVGDDALLTALHPTPAVGGYPVDGALDRIFRLEPHDRGWYAGPVGWIGADKAGFAVAIRSGLVENDRLTVFAGAGIVKGSDPDREWVETGHKMASLLSLFERT
jgi:menaquinone-specific isochorismate synthase